MALGWNYRMSDVVGAVALAQTERMEELCDMRKASGKIIEQAAAGCDWLIPQYTPRRVRACLLGGCHSYGQS